MINAGFKGLFGTTFVLAILKMLGVVTADWYFVFMPIIAPFYLLGIVFTIICFMLVVSSMFLD